LAISFVMRSQLINAKQVKQNNKILALFFIKANRLF
jgi:hypothetical protein